MNAFLGFIQFFGSLLYNLAYMSIPLIVLVRYSIEIECIIIECFKKTKLLLFVPHVWC